MKDYDIKLTDENIKETIKNDNLKRNSKLNKLIELLINISGNKIIDIDGKWGSGKTIFLKQLEFINKSNIDDLEAELTRVKEFNENYIVYYYNAWENDFHTSPVLSLIYNLINDFPSKKKQTASGKIELPFDLKGALKAISHNFIDPDKVTSFSDIASEIYTLEEKRTALSNIIDSVIPKDKKLVFIIDELDRCKPDFAINMLETIKHLYANERIIFLLGTNNEQLSYTISHFYGDNFDGYGYLNKFYNLIIELNDISPSMYLESVIGIANSSKWKDIALYAVCTYFDFQMRDINRIVNDFYLLNNYFDNLNVFEYEQDKILKYIFLPYCLGLKQKEKTLLSNFLKGKGYNDLESFVISNKQIMKIIEHDFKNAKTPEEEINDSNTLQYLKNKYNCYFSTPTDDWELNQAKKVFMSSLSLLGNYIKYD